MDKMQTMTAAALSAMTHVLDLVPEDRVLVLTDPETRSCGEAFAAAAGEHGCRVEIYALPAEGRPLTAAPADLLALLDGTTVVINAIVGDAAEIPFRLEWLHAIEATGRIRTGHSPGIDEDMMIAGPLNIDYGAMADHAAALLTALEGVQTLHITSAAGTDLTLDVTDRGFVSDIKATVEEGANLPCGEVFCCPVETAGDGVLVVDGCFGSRGTVPRAVTIELKNGQVTNVRCEDPDTLKTILGLMDTDDGSRTVAELGIGVNPGARMTDRMLEAEKTGGTAHIAFGDNQGMPGGRSHSATHIDYLFSAPSIVATLADGSERTVLENGHLAR